MNRDLLMDVSVVLSTYNRCHLLAGTLDSLLEQQTNDLTYEIIVVDNNSTDSTREVIERVAQRTSLIRYIFEPRQGLSYGWNTGILQATGSIVALIDDDLIATTNYVQSINQVFREHPEIMFLGGKIWPRWPTPPPSWLTRDHWSPLALQDYGDTSFYTYTENPVPLVNKAFRRTVFSEIGLFHTSLGKVGDTLGDVGDHELMLRIWHAGGRGMYAPSVVVYAIVQEERLTKAYHKEWHTKHGKLSARMALANPASALFRRVVLGAPISPYRRLLKAILGYPGAKLRHEDARLFYFENRIRYATNYLIEYYCGLWSLNTKSSNSF